MASKNEKENCVTNQWSYLEWSPCGRAHPGGRLSSWPSRTSSALCPSSLLGLWNGKKYQNVFSFMFFKQSVKIVLNYFSCISYEARGTSIFLGGNVNNSQPFLFSVIEHPCICERCLSRMRRLVSVLVDGSLINVVQLKTSTSQSYSWLGFDKIGKVMENIQKKFTSQSRCPMSVLLPASTCPTTTTLISCLPSFSESETTFLARLGVDEAELITASWLSLEFCYITIMIKNNFKNTRFSFSVRFWDLKHHPPLKLWQLACRTSKICISVKTRIHLPNFLRKIVIILSPNLDERRSFWSFF